MSVQDAYKRIHNFTEPDVYFMCEDWVFKPNASWDQRESDFKKQTAYRNDDEFSNFNLWTGNCIDDTYIAPPYVPDRGFINISGKECDPLYWLLVDVYSTKEINERRYRDDASYRNQIKKSASEAWQQLAKNLQFWHDLEAVIWNSKERQIHIDQCWFFGKIEIHNSGTDWEKHKNYHIDKNESILKTYSQLSSSLKNTVPAPINTKVSPTNKNSEKKSSDDTKHKPATDKKKEQIVGVIFWVILIGIYAFTSADLLHSALSAFFFALAAYIII